MTNIPAIDLVWEAVNSLGGCEIQDSSYDQGFVDGISKALEAIEKLGGRDPQMQRVAERRNHNAKHPLPVIFE
jgi:hypothetical protein